MNDKTMRKILLFTLLLFLAMPLVLVVRGEWEVALYWYGMLGMAWVGEWFAKWLNKHVKIEEVKAEETDKNNENL